MCWMGLDELQADIDRRIVDGYRRHPPTKDEDALAQANARAAIRDEPWHHGTAAPA
jgi:hypothetical protein